MRENETSPTVGGVVRAIVLMGVILLGVGALGANCEPTPPPGCQPTPRDCKAEGKITACINHCLVPVPNGVLCALDSCDLFVGGGIPNAGVCGEGSACVRMGGLASNVGICTPIPIGTAPGCSAVSGTNGFNPDDQNECPYGGYCAALGETSGTCGAADPLQNGLPGMCRRYARVGELCDGVGSDARRGTQRNAGCNVCEPGARCIAVNRFRPDEHYTEAGHLSNAEFRCVRTCQSGSSDECDCPSAPPNAPAASRCFGAWPVVGAYPPSYHSPSGTINPAGGGTEGPICVRPEWCANTGESCGGQQVPEYNCDTSPPPVVNTHQCFRKRCCQRGAACLQGVCAACIEDGTTTTTESRCCLNAHFVLGSGGPGLGTCHACRTSGQSATGQAQCCPGLRFANLPGGGQCITCRAMDQTASDPRDCCPGLALFAVPGSDSICNPCRTTGETASSTSECCFGLVRRRLRNNAEDPVEGVGPEVCAPPCEACIPYPPGDPNIPTAGRCARGNPTACPIDGLTPKPMCVRNGPITETCGPEDDNCNGPPFDVADAMLGRPCTMPQLPPSSGCGATPGANWVTGSYTGHRALGGHRVCDPVSGTVACVAIPGIDFCNAVNCRLFCGAEPCRSFRRTDESNTAVTVSGTGQPAFWNDARILFATGDPDVFTPVDWNMDGIHQGCPGFCPEQTCNMGGSCGAGLECAIADPALNTCVERRGCPAEQSPVVCWNHISESNNNVGGCR